jgi:hypothetical protein
MSADHALAVLAQAGAWGGDDARAVTLSNLGAAELWAGDLDAAEVHLRGRAPEQRGLVGEPAPQQRSLRVNGDIQPRLPATSTASRP